MSSPRLTEVFIIEEGPGNTIAGMLAGGMLVLGTMGVSAALHGKTIDQQFPNASRFVSNLEKSFSSDKPHHKIKVSNVLPNDLRKLVPKDYEGVLEYDRKFWEHVESDPAFQKMNRQQQEALIEIHKDNIRDLDWQMYTGGKGFSPREWKLRGEYDPRNSE